MGREKPGLNPDVDGATPSAAAAATANERSRGVTAANAIQERIDQFLADLGQLDTATVVQRHTTTGPTESNGRGEKAPPPVARARDERPDHEQSVITMETISRKLKTVGTEEAGIAVTISYHIIDIFSQQLYLIPNKALEELVANSYDAFATHVHVVVPQSVNASDAVIWVVDDGTGMNAQGLVALWQVGQSPKREGTSTGRLPIGRFGIGKLSTYVLARQLTHITTADGVYRSVTIDFGDVGTPSHGKSKELTLPMRVLTEEQAKEVLDPLFKQMGDAGKVLKLFGPDAAPTWTVAAMAQLKPLATELKPGPLKWVLSTALPISPDFELFYNGQRLESSKEKKEPLEKWTIGVEDKQAGEPLWKSGSNAAAPQ